MEELDLGLSIADLSGRFTAKGGCCDCAEHVEMLMRVLLFFSLTPPPSFLLFQYYFTISFTHENQKALELRTEDVKDCDEWVAAISHARYARCLPVADADSLN